MKEKIINELQIGGIAGPFSSPPFKNFQINPLFLRAKSSGGFRMILDLSYPKSSCSVNANIDQKLKSVQYSNVRQAIGFLSQNRNLKYSAKVDIKDAFRLIPIHDSDIPKLGFKFENKFYFDRVLPQGCGSSCLLFEKLATALQHIFSFYAPNCFVMHYLDDFIFFATTFELCETYQNLFIQICKFLEIPLSPKKCTKPSTETTFLGITIDTIKQAATLPTEKLEAYASEITQFLEKRFATTKQIQSLIGKLNFAASVVPGRAFLRRLINLLPPDGRPKLIFLSKAVKLDLITWLKFLKVHNGCTFFRFSKTFDSRLVNLNSDASKKACGATFLSRWFVIEFSPSCQLLNIAVLELYPLVVLIEIYGKFLKNSTVLFHCDNMAICHVVNKLTSKHFFIMTLVRRLVPLITTFNIDLRAVHLPGVKNILCDKLSRLQVSPSLLEQHHMLPKPDLVPEHLHLQKLLSLPPVT